VVETTRGQALAEEYSIKFFEVSAKNNISIEEAFRAIAKDVKKQLMDNPLPLVPSSSRLTLTKPKIEKASFPVISIFDMERCITIKKRQELIVTGSTDSLAFRLSSYPTLFKPPQCMIDINEYSSYVILSPHGADLGPTSVYEHRHRIVIVRLAPLTLASLLQYCQRKSKRFLGRLWFGNFSSPSFAQFIIERMAAPLLLDPNKFKTDDEVTMQSIIGPFLYSKCEEKQWPLSVIVDVSTPSTVASTSVPVVNGWIPDEMASSCTLCSTEFTFFTRRHHCRRCGHVICNDCSQRRRNLLLHTGTEHRICDSCEKLFNESEAYHLTYYSSTATTRGDTKRSEEIKVPADTKPLLRNSRPLSPSSTSRTPAWLDPKILRSLEFGELSLNDIQCRALTHSFYWNCTLLRLHITQSYLSPQHLTWLIDSIIDHPVLEELVLQHNDINHTCGGTIARYLTRAPSLKILDISFNNVADGASVIFEALPYARQLRELYIEYNRIGQSTTIEFPLKVSVIAWTALATSISKTRTLPFHIISVNGNLLDLLACHSIASSFTSRGTTLANRGSLELRLVDTNMSLSDMKQATAHLVGAGITTISEKKKALPVPTPSSSMGPSPSVAQPASASTTPSSASVGPVKRRFGPIAPPSFLASITSLNSQSAPAITTLAPTAEEFEVII
jgi:hypothetical protein